MLKASQETIATLKFERQANRSPGAVSYNSRVKADWSRISSRRRGDPGKINRDVWRKGENRSAV